jgi:hypothetical protein
MDRVILSWCILLGRHDYGCLYFSRTVVRCELQFLVIKILVVLIHWDELGAEGVGWGHAEMLSVP